MRVSERSGEMPSRTALITMKLFFVFAIIFLFFGNNISNAEETTNGISWGEFQYPPIEYRPWTRWWWPGNDVEDDELRREVGLLKDNFYGGAEIQPFIMGLDPGADNEEMKRRMSFDSPSFYSRLSTVMEAAGDKGIGIDLNLGSGWPSGGQHIGPDQNLKTLLFSEQKVRGGRGINVKLKDPKKPIFYYIANIVGSILNIKVSKWHGDDAKIFAVVAAKITGGKRSLNPITYSDTIELDPESVVVLTDKVDAKRRLKWQATPGKWMIITIYIAPNGEFPTLAAQDPAGYVVDHFDREASLYHFDHLLGERTGLAKYYGAPFRAFFNDSFEFKAERHVSEDFLAEFEKRRGYDLTPFLPVVLIPGADNFFYEMIAGNRQPEYKMTDMDRRVRYDYQLTMSDLFIERYLDTAREWAGKHGINSRAQCYGMDIDVIRAAGHAHIPETEQLYAGGSEMFLKIASSGAHLYNRPVVTSESMVWSGRDYMTTPLKIKAAADKLFTSGINQIIYHGYTYKKDDPEYGETGWYPWSSPFSAPGVFSSNLSEINPYFKYMKDLNLYIARCQYLLRQGKPDYDLIVYYPWLGLPSSFGNAEGHEEFLFNGHFPGEPESGGGIEDVLAFLPDTEHHVDPRIAWLQKVWPLLQELENNGYTWEWVNDHSLAEAELKGGKINIRGNEYKALVIAHAPWMQPEAAEKLAELAKNGLAVVRIGYPPVTQPGFYLYASGDKKVAFSMEKVLSSSRAVELLEGDSITGKLGSIGLRQEIDFDYFPEGVKQIRRRLPNGDKIFLFRNTSRETKFIEFDFHISKRRAAWIDPWTGDNLELIESHLCTCFGDRAGDTVHQGGINGLGTAMVITSREKTSPLFDNFARNPNKRKEYHYFQAYYLYNSKGEIKSDWELEIKGEDIKKGQLSIDMTGLRDWREIDELRFCSSPVVYRSTINLPEIKEREHVYMDLGEVYSAAEVKVNGKSAGIVVIAPFRINITEQAKEGLNLLEIKVTPTLRNRFISRAESKDERYKQFKGKEDTLVPAGLIGPVYVRVFEWDSEEFPDGE
jgi:hypothetical protein